MSNDEDSHGFLHAPPTTTITTNDLDHQQEPPSITQESQLAAAVGRAISSIRNVVATVSNSPSLTPSLNNNQDQPSKTTTATRRTRRRRPFRRTTSDKKECPQIKRLRKMEEMVTEIKQMCWEFTRESGEVVTQELEHNGDHDENQSVNEAKVEQDEQEKEDEDIEDRVEFKQVDDGSLRIQLSCSCTKRFEILHNKIGCFYRLI